MKDITRKELLKRVPACLAAISISGKFISYLFANEKGYIPQRVTSTKPVKKANGTWQIEITNKNNENKYISLNKTAYDIWQLIDGSRNTHQITHALSKKYNISAKFIKQDISNFIKIMYNQNLII